MSSEFGFLVYCLHIHLRDTNTDENIVVVVVVAGDDSLADARDAPTAWARRRARWRRAADDSSGRVIPSSG